MPPLNTSTMRVAVIGAGPSGLVTLKYLKTAHHFFPGKPVEAVLFESESVVGGTFAQRAYEDAELVSSKFLTSFSDFRVHENDPDFLSAEKFVQYLNDYCDNFNLWPDINLSTKVVAIKRRLGGGHIVYYRKANDVDAEVLTYECDAIAVCTGLHVVPNIPNLPGIENIPVVKHSSEFKKREEFGRDKTVVILGSGETGIDIAHLAVTSPTKRVVLTHRDGFLGAPKVIPNPVWFPILGRKADPNRRELPVDVSWQAPLFDSMYLHPLIRDTLFTWNVYDWGVKATNWLVSGTIAGIDQWVGGISKERYHVSKLFFNKGAPKALPYISAPYRPTNPGIIERIRRSILQAPVDKVEGDRTIELAPWPTHVDASGTIYFKNNRRPEYSRMQDIGPTKPDVLVFATGYRQEFPFFQNQGRDSYPVPSSADVRSIWSRADPSVGFIGFVRPGYGAIPPLAELQAQLWLLNLMIPERTANLRDDDDHHFRLRSNQNSRINYGVDHETYAYQLALDIGSAPAFWDAVRAGWSASRYQSNLWYRIPIIWAAGAQLNPKFRLKGPYSWDGATQVLGNELWQTISRRHGMFGNFFLAVVPITLLGVFSLFLYLVGLILLLVKVVTWPITAPFRHGRRGVIRLEEGRKYTKIES
ncbi:Dimethylaniline monooxygenase [N-oxide-forming] 4 [Daldinia childiae]|uniref:Dimethylaniline monooxygenase [N-oxide-forming] 4 n=1 Tax=Daldinia childiae TaxID=326645 RepID=UPI00144874A2|nr:Dimethylaniline monooxygenase [N-oxide-forming] 4 [Daldinia childiae]KAF3064254.1 Dimethylaniline monooxygenase [N-oxide-forming] 4 [Daldinia childiae]